MIFLIFMEIYLMNNIININHDENYIKDIIIVCTLGSIIYLLLHQANQVLNTSFKFQIYNKMLIGIMIVDIIICLFFISKYLVNYGVNMTEN